MVQVCAAAVKLMPLTFAPFTLIACDDGVKLKELFAGVTV